MISRLKENTSSLSHQKITLNGIINLLLCIVANLVVDKHAEFWLETDDTANVGWSLRDHLRSDRGYAISS